MSSQPRLEPAYPDSPVENSFADGVEFQDWVCDLLADRWNWIVQNYGSKSYQLHKGENRQRMEIKLDRRCTDTGRLSIEVAEKTRREQEHWSDSGIMRDSMFYVQGNREVVFVFATKHLRVIYGRDDTKVEEAHGTVRKFYLDMERARGLAVGVIDV